jgi:hypothetical protein
MAIPLLGDRDRWPCNGLVDTHGTPQSVSMFAMRAVGCSAASLVMRLGEAMQDENKSRRPASKAVRHSKGIYLPYP